MKTQALFYSNGCYENVRAIKGITFILFPAVLVEWLVYKLHINWLYVGIFDFDYSSNVLTSIYFVLATVLKFSVLGIMYWFMLALPLILVSLIINKPSLRIPR